MRVFLQDGKRDNNIYAGNWYIANQDMAARSSSPGYDVQIRRRRGRPQQQARRGDSAGCPALALARLSLSPSPKPTRRPAAAYRDRDPRCKLEWRNWSAGHQVHGRCGGGPQGNVYFSDIPNNRIHKITASIGKVSVFKEDTGGTNGVDVGSRRTALRLPEWTQADRGLWDAAGKETVIAEGVDSNDLCVSAKGESIFTDPPGKRCG